MGFREILPISIDNTAYMRYNMTMTAKQLMSAFEAAGWVKTRISASHHIYEKPGFRCFPIPLHGNRDLPRRIVKNGLALIDRDQKGQE